VGYTGIFSKQNGGNVDIKDLTIGSRIYFPVCDEGAKLSMGDLHFSQGTARSPSAAPSRWPAT